MFPSGLSARWMGLTIGLPAAPVVCQASVSGEPPGMESTVDDTSVASGDAVAAMRDVATAVGAVELGATDEIGFAQPTSSAIMPTTSTPTRDCFLDIALLSGRAPQGHIDGREWLERLVGFPLSPNVLSGQRHVTIAAANRTKPRAVVRAGTKVNERGVSGGIVTGRGTKAAGCGRN